MKPAEAAAHAVPKPQPAAAHAVPKPQGSAEVKAFVDTMEPILSDYWSAEVIPVMQDAVHAAARHEHNPQLLEAMGKLNMFVVGVPERMANELAQMPDLETMANVISDLDIDWLTRQVEESSRGYHPSHPDYGPRSGLVKALEELRKVTAKRALERNVFEPAAEQMGHTS